MNDGDEDDVPVVPTTYTNQVLTVMRNEAKTALTTRKLNTEFLLIKNLILGVNSTGLTNYVYTYTYDPINLVNDYFFQLLNKIQTMFLGSTINYVINVSSNDEQSVFQNANHSAMEFNVNLLYTKDASSDSYLDLTRPLNVPNSVLTYNPITNLIKIDWFI
jgi:hypothetical protein